MFNLIKIDDRYIIQINDHKSELLDFAQVVKAMLSIKVCDEQIKHAFTEFVKNDHNFANFGIKKTFIFSDKRKVA